MGAVFGFLLIMFLIAFFGMESYIVNYMGKADVRIMGVSLLSNGVQAFLGIAILFCQFAIILFSMLDRVGETIRDIIKPLIRIIPLWAFISVSYSTFSPLFFSLFPPNVAMAMGVPTYENFSFAQAVNQQTFSEGILVMSFTMLLFVIATAALRDKRDTARVKQLEAQIRRLKRSM